MRLLGVAIVLSMLWTSVVGRAQESEPTCAVAAPGVVCEGWSTTSCPGGRLEVTLGESVAQVAVRNGRACALTSSAALWCWDREDVRDTCAAVTPREIVAVRGRAAAVALSARGTYVLLTDGTVAAWIDRTDSGTRAEAWAEVRLLSSADGPLANVRALAAGWSDACVVVGASDVWCWDHEHPLPLPTRLAVGHPVARLQCEEGCCALGPDGEATCWGRGRGMIEALLADTPDRVDFVWNHMGGCVASERRVECDEGMRPDAGRFVYWRGFELRGDERALDLRLSADDAVCLETTTRTLCWGVYGPSLPLRGVRPIPSPTSRRLVSGERVLRARVSALTCEEDGSFDERVPTVTAHTTRGRVRFDIDGLVSNCGYDPTIDVTLRADGTITLAPGDPPPNSPLASCECSFDLRVLVRGVPAGPHPVRYLFHDDAGTLVTEVVAR
jgi:hypothetical protein